MLELTSVLDLELEVSFHHSLCIIIYSYVVKQIVKARIQSATHIHRHFTHAHTNAWAGPSSIGDDTPVQENGRCSGFEASTYSMRTSPYSQAS